MKKKTNDEINQLAGWWYWVSSIISDATVLLNQCKESICVDGKDFINDLKIQSNCFDKEFAILTGKIKTLKEIIRELEKSVRIAQKRKCL